MKSTSDKSHSHCLISTSYLFAYSTCIAVTTVFCFHLIFRHINIKYTSNHNQKITFIEKGIETCDLFEGRWVPDTAEPLYTNYSCKTLPVAKNCFLHGRRDRDFLHWRWKPNQCELPRFDARAFLSILRGKTMAFIGDSVARNQMESLLCLLATAETPKSIEKDADDRFTTWYFSNHNFTLQVFWSQFLVTAVERRLNGTATGSFDLHLDHLDPKWSEKLPSIDYAVFSDAHWFTRENYLYEDGNLIGCIYCNAPGIPAHGPDWAIRRAFGAAFQAINDCKDCKKITSFLRTFSPAHFENGAWDNGGGCNRTMPIERAEVNEGEWEVRKIQMEEVERAMNVGSGNVFEVIDVTEMMAVRADGHPNMYWGNKWMKGYNDCLHWCMPGPVDTWNELLLERIRRQQLTTSS